MRTVPQVAHLVVSLAHGGLERLVVDWANARNRRWPGSTWVVCLDAPGDLAPQVEGGCVVCLQADRSRWPWDWRAVAALKALVSEQLTEGATFNAQRSTLNVQRPTLNAQRPSGGTLHRPPCGPHRPPCP